MEGGSNTCRTLLDLMGETIDKYGRVLVGYADGCIQCDDVSGSRSKKATIARQVNGRRMFAKDDPTSEPSPTPTDTPTATPTPLPDSCDGVNVVTDPSGDAINAAPGGQGPTDQADITAISFSVNGAKTIMTVKMTFKNLSNTPSPGTTTTAYHVAWTAPDGNQYAIEADAPDPTNQLGYYWGPWNAGTDQLSSYNVATGTFNPGPNGIITVNVPVSGVGNPTIPITDASGTPAVTNPYGVTLGGEGVVGNGEYFVKEMDRAPDFGFGQRWAVCGSGGGPTPTPTPTPQSESACVAPGLTTATDPAGDQISGTGAAENQLDVQSVRIAETYTNPDDLSMTFTLKVANLSSPLPPNATWFMRFNANDTTGTSRPLFVDMNTNGADPRVVQFGIGRTDVIQGNNVDTTQTTLSSIVSGSFTSDGLIKIKLKTSLDMAMTATGAPNYTVNLAPGPAVGENSGEPSIGYNPSSGRAMFIAGLQTLRVTFPEKFMPLGSAPEAEPAQWDDVSSIITKTRSVDPILFTDQRTGRTFVSQLNSLTQTAPTGVLIGLNSLMAYSDDDGVSWTPAQVNPPDGSYDHQSVGGGPYPAALSALSNPLNKGDAVYYCGQAGVATFCSRSDDGGLNFGRAMLVNTSVSSSAGTGCGALHGHVKVAPDGTVYLPHYSCNGKQGVAVSTDAGTTWTVRQVSGSLPPVAGILDPTVAISSDNSVYFAWVGKVPNGNNTDNHIFVSSSKDRGVTWTTPVDVGADLGIKNAVFPSI